MGGVVACWEAVQSAEVGDLYFRSAALHGNIEDTQHVHTIKFLPVNRPLESGPMCFSGVARDEGPELSGNPVEADSHSIQLWRHGNALE